MENINMQSQNEVKELLNEYVVTPLNDDISKTLSDMKEKIESLDETVKCEIVKISPTVNGNLDRLKKLLDKSFHFDDDEDAFEKICDDITDDIDAIIKEVKSLEDSINYIVTKIHAIQNVYTEKFSNINIEL